MPHPAVPRRGLIPILASLSVTSLSVASVSLALALVPAGPAHAQAQTPAQVAPSTAATTAAAVAAPVAIEKAWVRATVPSQRSTGAFLELTATAPLSLVGVESPAADIVEVHEMAIVDNIMRMRAIDSLALEPGKPVELKPGGLHVMLIDLRAPVAAGDRVPLTLIFEDARGQRSSRQIEATARPLTESSHGDDKAARGHGNQGGQASHGQPTR